MKQLISSIVLSNLLLTACVIDGPTKSITVSAVESIIVPPVESVTVPPVESVTVPPVESVTVPPVESVTVPPVTSTPIDTTTNFIAFESGWVRPMALSKNGATLFAVNTADNRVEIFKRESEILTPISSLPVGMEPVALAVRNTNELWVVNHLSDSISIVDISSPQSYVKRTLLVGDEPRDIVFAEDKAFITTAHRGQHRSHPSIKNVEGAGSPKLNNSGIGRADVWVFDANNLGKTLGGTPKKIITLFGDTPRALAVTPDESRVYAAIFNSGNQTSIVHESVMCSGFEDTPAGPAGTGASRSGNESCVAGNIPADDASQSPNGLQNKRLPKGRPLPSTNIDGENQPWTSMIVKYDQATKQWQDSRGLNYSNAIRFNLPDKDVFSIDTNTLNEVDHYSGVGTTLFNMVVNPVNGNIYVSNTDANNATRFEGSGQFGGSTVQCNIAKSQITVINPETGSVKMRHLNSHIDYKVLKSPTSTKLHSIAIPTEMQVSADGKQLYIAAMGSNKVATYKTEELESDALWDGNALNGEFDPSVSSQQHINTNGGPAGILLADDTLYVFSRFNNSIQSFNIKTREQIQTTALYNPEPESIKAGRFMLYDANRTSSNGESACASCHTFGDTDHLSWNLGNPDASNSKNTQPFPNENLTRLGCDLIGPTDESCQLLSIMNGNSKLREFASMKGPMATQTLRGTSTHGHMHWRGDRVNGYFGLDNPSGKDDLDAEILDERLSFKNFIVAFEGLLGMDVNLPASVKATEKSAGVIELEEDMDKFTDFMLSVQLPPNPIRPLDNSHSPSAHIGANFFDGARRSDGVDFDFVSNGNEADGMTCSGCHTINPDKGFFGSDGRVASGGEVQILKVPQLRNLYTRVGMFGLPNRHSFLPSTTDAHQGDQIRGFGFLHDGATDKLFNFLQGGVFDNGEEPCFDNNLAPHFGCDFNSGFVGIPDDKTRQGLVDFLMEADSDLAPIVGQQITLSATTKQEAIQRVNLLEQRASTAFSSKILNDAFKNSNKKVTECDLVAHGRVNNTAKSYLFNVETQQYNSDTNDEVTIPKDDLKNLSIINDNTLTFTCLPPGSGYRNALDRNLDDTLNRD